MASQVLEELYVAGFLVSRLITDSVLIAGLAKKLGSTTVPGVYEDVPEGAPHPFITVEQVGMARDVREFDTIKIGQMLVYDVKVVGKDVDYKALLAITGRFLPLLDGAAGTFNGVDIVSCTGSRQGAGKRMDRGSSGIRYPQIWQRFNVWAQDANT